MGTSAVKNLLIQEHLQGGAALHIHYRMAEIPFSRILPFPPAPKGCFATLYEALFGSFTKSSACLLRVKYPQLRYDPPPRALVPELTHK